MLIPNKIFLTRGVGIHKDKLASFEAALRAAGIECCNLVCVSSILPPSCKMISRAAGLKLLHSGQLAFCVMARNETNEPGRIVSSSIGIAAPKEKHRYGYLSEHHSFGEKAKEAGDYAEDLAATMLATTLGIDFDSDQAWDERKEVYHASGHIIKTKNITMSTMGDSRGQWTSVIAVAVFLLD
ncbi:pyruvoyl-dependent arginine decarboxylase [Elusimicrobiota bacterium]